MPRGATQPTAGGNTSPTTPTTTKPKPKKKGTASNVKKGPRKSKVKTTKSVNKKKGAAPGATETEATPADDGGATTDEESDHGPYCICRGPDDHRWMISCEACEDWFHGECVKLDKETGETLIEKYICPNCTDGRQIVTRYKKMCSLEGCRKPARIYAKKDKDKSVFCSDDHANAWWERLVATLPTKSGKPAYGFFGGERLTREEFMALLSGDLGGVDERTGAWKLAKHPFVRDTGLGQPDEMVLDEDVPVDHLTEEEKHFLDASAADRLALGEEILQCQKMIQLLDMAHTRLKTAISAGQLPQDGCGYDRRLDSVGVQADFRQFAESDEGKMIFDEQTLSDSQGLMCERKRCKQHQGWYSLFMRSVKIQIQELTDKAQQKLDQEQVFRRAAEERYHRKRVENNLVEVIESDNEERKPGGAVWT
jgi:COMPASS component SPP1